MTVGDRLDEALRRRGAPAGAEGDEGWRVRTRDEAAWASRKLAHVRRELEELEAWREREIARVEEAARSERERLERDVDYFEALLGAYLARLVAEGRRTKTLELPGGTVRLRRGNPVLHVEDEEAALAWLEEHAPEYLVTSHRVDRAGLKPRLATEGTRTVLAETGEVVPWARLEPGEERLHFDLPDDASAAADDEAPVPSRTEERA